MDYYIHPLGKPVLRITGDGVRSILVHTTNHFKLHDYIEELKDCYLSTSLNSGTGDVDFDDPTYQACYVFLYFPALCYGIFYGLQQCEPHFGSLFERAVDSNCLRVCSLGGGPGTDLFGLRMFLNHIGYEDVPVRATVFDKHPHWNLAFRCLSSELRPCNIYANYCRMEVMEKVQRDHLEAIAGADLITCSKFISAVRVLPNSRQNLTKLLMQAKSNAYLFYLDNSKGRNTEFIRDVLQRAGFTEFICFERDEDNPFQLPSNENSRYLEDLPRTFNFSSQRNLRVTFMLWQKNSPWETSSSTSSHRNQPIHSYRPMSSPTIIATHHVVNIPEAVPISSRRHDLEAQRNAGRSCQCIML